MATAPRRPRRPFAPERLEPRLQLSLTPAAPEVRLDPEQFNLTTVDAAMDAGGGFVATWDVVASWGMVFEWPKVQRFDRAGNPTGSLIRVDDPVSASPRPWSLLPFRPAIASDEAGNFVVAWSE